MTLRRSSSTHLWFVVPSTVLRTNIQPWKMQHIRDRAMCRSSCSWVKWMKEWEINFRLWNVSWSIPLALTFSMKRVQAASKYPIEGRPIESPLFPLSKHTRYSIWMRIKPQFRGVFPKKKLKLTLFRRDQTFWRPLSRIVYVRLWNTEGCHRDIHEEWNKGEFKN